MPKPKSIWTIKRAPGEEKPSPKTIKENSHNWYSLFTFSYCTPFVTVVSIQEPSLSVSSAKKKPADEEGLLSGGKMVATSTTASSKHLVRRQARTSSPVATANQKEPGYVTVLEIGNNNNNNNNNHKAEVKRPTHHHQHRFASYQFWYQYNQSIKPSCSKPTRTPSFQKNTTVTVQIKTNNKNGSSVKRSASASSSDIKPPQAIRSSDTSNKNKHVQTLPHRSRSTSETSTTRNHNVSSVEEDLVIYRLPGEKLGLGLRFEGGSKAHELVQRLFVQCCSKGSPAARTRCTWGSLSDGDEIISISGKLVRRMTRVDCVKALKGRGWKTFSTQKETETIIPASKRQAKHFDPFKKKLALIWYLMSCLLNSWTSCNFMAGYIVQFFFWHHLYQTFYY